MAIATTIQQQTQDVTLTLSLSDVSVLKEIKKALKLFRGVEKVKASTVTATAKPKELSGIQKALLDVKEGRVTKWDSVDQMFDTLMKD